VGEIRPGLRIVERPAPHGFYRELGAVAQALGVRHEGARVLEVEVNGALVTFELEINSGTVVGLTLTLVPPGPALPDEPAILLRREVAADRAGKQRGINVEVQLGDPRFDQEVYVDSDAREDEVQRVLAAPSVRGAVRELLGAGCEKVRLSRRGVEATWTTKGNDGLFDGPRLVSALQSVVTLAAAGGPHARGAPARGGWLVALTTLGLAAGVPYFLFARATWTTSAGLPLAGAVAGMVVALALRPSLARVLAGGSSSFARYRNTAAMLFFALGFHGAALPVHLNGALDGSRPTVVEGAVSELGARDDEDGKTDVVVRWSDGTHEDVRVRSPGTVGQRVTKQRHQGALGFGWWEAPVFH